MIADGYAAHLNELMSCETRRPVVSVAHLSARTGGFSLLGRQSFGKKPVRKSASLPQHSSYRRPVQANPMIAVSEAGNTVVENQPSSPVVAGRVTRNQSTSK